MKKSDFLNFCVSLSLVAWMSFCICGYEMTGQENYMNLFVFTSWVCVVLTLNSAISYREWDEDYRREIAERPLMQIFFFFYCDLCLTVYMVWNGWFVTGAFWIAGSLSNLSAILKARKGDVL